MDVENELFHPSLFLQDNMNQSVNRVGPATECSFTSDSGSRPRFRVAVMGTWNWLETAESLLRRAGIGCEVIDLRTTPDLARWALSGQWRRFDVVHHLWGVRRPAGLFFTFVRKPVVWHWIGSDVPQFAAIAQGGGGWRGAINRRIVYHGPSLHLADSPDLAEELSPLGIKAEVVRLLPKQIEAEVEPLPDRPRVLLYWSSTARKQAHASEIMKMAERFSEVEFLVVGDDGVGCNHPGNVVFLGRLPNLSDIYSKVSIYLRWLDHDSLSAMVLEALARGRYVIYSKEFPCTEFAQTIQEASESLTRLLQMSQPNFQGAQYVRNNFNLHEQEERLKNFYQRHFGFVK